MKSAAEIKRQYGESELRALARQCGLRVTDRRMQCPARCSDDPRRASVSTVDGVGVWHCKGCQSGGSAIDLYAAAMNVSLAQAIEKLDGTPPPAPAPARKAKSPIDGAAAWDRLASSDPAGQAYLDGRGLGAATERELVRFATGRCGDFWIDRRAGEGYRVAMPLRDKDGVVRTFQLRATHKPSDPTRTKLNLPGIPLAGLFFGDPKAARASEVVALTEGLADTLALQLSGIVTLGVPGVDQVRKLPSALGVVDGRTILLCPQNDAEHGKSESAFLSIVRPLTDAGADVRTLRTPSEHKDPADWLQSVGLDAFAAEVRAAIEAPRSNVVPLRPAASPDGEEGAEGLAPSDGRLRYPFTDLGNAERLVARHGHDLRFVHAWDRWLAWDGKRWLEDETGAVMRRAQETVRAMLHEAKSIANTELHDALLKHERKSESAGALRAMVSLARDIEGIPIQPSELDADPWLLNVQNGTLDLRTGKLSPHDRSQLLTKIAPVAYDPDAECPLWLAFLDRIFAGDQEIIGFMRRATGYALTGATGEHALFILYGTGRNGKGTYRDTIRAMLGDYSHEADFSTFVASKHDNAGGPREDLVALMGRRFVAASEATKGQRLDEALVKRLTGDDPIRARRLHENGFTFVPVAKYFLMVNDKPVIRGRDEGIWSRVRLVPFTVTIPDEERDKNLRNKLMAELPGILAWAVRGCLEWQAEGLKTPEAILVATQEYRDEMDVLGDFLTECCVMSAGAKVKTSDLYDAWKSWCDKNGQFAGSQNNFSRELTKRDLKQERNFALGRHWVGIGLLDESERRSEGAR